MISSVGHLGSGLVRSNGGVLTIVRSFRDALHGLVLSMTSPRDFVEDDLLPDINYIRGVRLCGKYCFPVGEELRKARELLGNVDLLTCHNLYRGHVHLVDSFYRERGIPYWVIPHGVLDPYVNKRNQIVKLLWMSFIGKAFLRNAKYVIYSTRREKLKAEFSRDLNNGIVINWPVAMSGMHSEGDRPRAHTDLRRRLGLNWNTRILLSFGRLHSIKRLKYLLELSCKINRAGFHLVIAGTDGDLTKIQLEEIAKAINAPATVLGPVYGDSKDQLLDSVDGYISLSAKENFNNTAAEAMAHGLPVILSTGNDLVGELSGVACGWLLHDDAEGSAIRAMEQFAMASEDELRELGGQGEKWVRSNLSKQMFDAKLRDLAAESVSVSIARRGTT